MHSQPNISSRHRLAAVLARIAKRCAVEKNTPPVASTYEVAATSGGDGESQGGKHHD